MIRVVVVGMGPIGISSATAVLADKGLQLVGLVDLDPAKIGKTLTELGVSVAGGPKVAAAVTAEGEQSCGQRMGRGPGEGQRGTGQRVCLDTGSNPEPG